MKTSLAVNKAANYLASTQLPGGGFESLSLPSRSAKRSDQTYQTTFFPSLILSALTSVDQAEIKTVRSKLCDYLLSQTSEAWSFNYWDRKSSEYKSKPYPDDLDDTFCALAALHLNAPESLGPKVLAAMAKLLIATEANEGGPYRTWLVQGNEEAWQDVDVVVNANIGYFLSLQEIELPSITNLIEKAITSNTLESPYYPNNYPLIYFIARWYRGKLTGDLTTKLLMRKHGVAWSHPQRTALAVTSLLRLGSAPELLRPAIERLLHLQQPDGSWEPEAFCTDPMLGTKPYYGSSWALATALCVEAITLFDEHSKRLQTKPQAFGKNTFYDQVTTLVDARINAIDHAELKRGLILIRQQITTQDEDSQIVLLPKLVAAATGVKPEDETMLQLASASMWGWMAYTTYDDFLDGEGDLRLLPAANVCLRSLVEVLSAVLPDSEPFHKEVRHIMDRLDAANAWEMVQCRGELKNGNLHLSGIPNYGDYWQLADRSLGHTISGLGVLYATGVAKDSLTMVALRNFFFHYLIARQLNDDAHDWYEDLQFGHVNAVAAKLLARQHPVIPKKGLVICLADQHAVLQQIMWQEVIDEVCTDVNKHLVLARQALVRKGVKAEPKLFEKFLLPIEGATKRALQKRNEASEFIAAL